MSLATCTARNIFNLNKVGYKICHQAIQAWLSELTASPLKHLMKNELTIANSTKAIRVECTLSPKSLRRETCIREA